MSRSQYSNPRPEIPVATRRTIEVESGHCCAVKGCGEHTYLEIHHIDGDRENNGPSNLILLCDKHHKMAHANVIDRKALREYKKLLARAYDAAIHERVARLEQLIAENQGLSNDTAVVTSDPIDSATAGLQKQSPNRADILNFVLKHVAIRYFEQILEVPFEHQVIYKRGEKVLRLDALRQDDRLDHDFIIEVQYLRKSYEDAPVYGKWVEAKVELYELLTGRKARGILMVIVGRDNMKDNLPLTAKGIHECTRRIELEVFTCSEIGFNPGPVSLALAQSFLENAPELEDQRSESLLLPEDSVKNALVQRFLDDE